jgi:pimeloyl-ACP methyl ester carboxylesterase
LTAPARSKQTLVANGVGICAETFGDPADPALLLIMGASAPMEWWDDEFCEQLADGGRYVIRYDHRDTGESVSYEPGAPGYTGADLTSDAVGLLGALGLDRAHLVGISMGGGIAQEIALDHPDRVATLTLISTSPAVSGAADRNLPSMSAEASARFAAIATPDWSDREAVIDYIVAQERACAGSIPFDEERFRAYAVRVFDRTINIESAMTNHDLMESAPGSKGSLDEITAPTLVIHGTEDPLFPLPHGEALAEEIPGARLLTLERVGHELPRETWDRVVPAILDHTALASATR